MKRLASCLGVLALLVLVAVGTAYAESIDVEHPVVRVPRCARLCKLSERNSDDVPEVGWGPAKLDRREGREYLSEVVRLAGEDPKDYDLEKALEGWSEGRGIYLHRRGVEGFVLLPWAHRSEGDDRGDGCEVCVTVQLDGRGEAAWAAFSESDRRVLRAAWERMRGKFRAAADDYRPGACSWDDYSCERWSEYYDRLASSFDPRDYEFWVWKAADACYVVVMPLLEDLKKLPLPYNPETGWVQAFGPEWHMKGTVFRRDEETGECVPEEFEEDSPRHGRGEEGTGR